MSLTPPTDVSTSPEAAELIRQADEAEVRGMHLDEDVDKSREGDEAEALSLANSTNVAHQALASADSKASGSGAGKSVGLGAGEMERRAEEKLLDVRVREKYQREIGDIFANDD